MAAGAAFRQRRVRDVGAVRSFLTIYVTLLYIYMTHMQPERNSAQWNLPSRGRARSGNRKVANTDQQDQEHDGRRDGRDAGHGVQLIVFIIKSLPSWHN